MNNTYKKSEKGNDFLAAVGNLSEFGFKFASAYESGAKIGRDFSASEPSVVMVADPGKMHTPIPYAIACMYEEALSSSYLYIALDRRELTMDQSDELTKLGGFFFKTGDGDTLYGFIPMKTEGGKADSYGPQYASDLTELCTKLSNLKLPSVPYPCTAQALSVLPMFADFAYDGINAKNAVAVLGKHFRNSSDIFKMTDSLKSLVDESVLQSRSSPAVSRTGLSQAQALRA